MDEDQVESIDTVARQQNEWERLSPISFAELETVVNKWFLLNDEGIIRIVCAIVIANMLSGDPVWMFLVGPSSSGKTEFITALNGIPSIYSLSTLTTNTFISGMVHARNEPSLLKELKNNTIITFKDFTTILQSHYETRNELMSQLREIYDGSYEKRFGTGKKISWKGKLGFIAGVTTIIDITQQLYSALGERFIQYRMRQPDRELVAMRALDNAGKMFTMREEFKNAFASYIKGINIPSSDAFPSLSQEEQKELIRLTNFVTLGRSSIIRDSGMTKEILFMPSPEMPTRFTQQLNQLAIAFMIMNDGKTISDLDRRILYKVALDSIPQMRRSLLRAIAQYDSAKTADLAMEIGYPTNTTRRYLEDLNTLGILTRDKVKANADLWSIKEEWREVMEKYEGVTMKEKTTEEVMKKVFFGEKDISIGDDLTT